MGQFSVKISKADMSKVSKTKSRFMLDSGCNAHSVNDRRMLSNIRSIPRTSVSGISNKEEAIFYTEEMGTVTVLTKDGTALQFDAIYVPGLEDNFFSLYEFGQKIERIRGHQ